MFADSPHEPEVRQLGVVTVVSEESVQLDVPACSVLLVQVARGARSKEHDLELIEIVKLYIKTNAERSRQIFKCFWNHTTILNKMKVKIY